MLVRLGLRQVQLQDSILHLGFRLLHNNRGRKVNNTANLIGASFAVDGLPGLGLILGFPLAGNRHAARFHVDMQITLLEAWYIRANCEVLGGFRDFNVKGMEELRLGLKPIVQIVTEDTPVVLEYLEGAGGNKIIDIKLIFDELSGFVTWKGRLRFLQNCCC